MQRQKQRILYVDDDPDGCELMKVWLRSDNIPYDVTAVTTAEDANFLIAQFHFDLYVMDYCLPDMSGPQLCRMIRNADKTTPVLIFSALARPIDREMAINAGASSYLVKPDDFELLRPTIRQLLARRTDSSSRESGTDEGREALYEVMPRRPNFKFT